MDKSKEAIIAGKWFRLIGYTGIWYMVIALPVQIGLRLLLNFLGEDGDEGVMFLFSSLSTCIFLFVIGIVMPLIYSKHYLAMGVTRKQMARGMLMAAVGLALVATVVHALVNLMGALTGYLPLDASAIPLQMAIDLFSFITFYLAGWVVAIGFGYKRFLTAAGSILVAGALFQVSNYLIGVPYVWDAGSGPIPVPLRIVLVIVLAAGFSVAVTPLIRRLPIKAS